MFWVLKRTFSLSTHNICFSRELINYFSYALLTKGMGFKDYVLLFHFLMMICVSTQENLSRVSDQVRFKPACSALETTVKPVLSGHLRVIILNNLEFLVHCSKGEQCYMDREISTVGS